MVSAKKLCYVALLTALTVVLGMRMMGAMLISSLRRTFLSERHRDLFCGAGVRSAFGVYRGGRGRVPRRFLLLSRADVRFACLARVAGGGDFVDFRGRKGVEKGIFVRGKAGIAAVLSCRSGAADGNGDYGNGLYAGQGVCVRHEGICDYQTAVRNSAGGRRGGDCADFSL